jgi:hypothetical protein
MRRLLGEAQDPAEEKSRHLAVSELCVRLQTGYACLLTVMTCPDAHGSCQDTAILAGSQERGVEGILGSGRTRDPRKPTRAPRPDTNRWIQDANSILGLV